MSDSTSNPTSPSANGDITVMGNGRRGSVDLAQTGTLKLENRDEVEVQATNRHINGTTQSPSSSTPTSSCETEDMEHLPAVPFKIMMSATSNASSSATGWGIPEDEAQTPARGGPRCNANNHGILVITPNYGPNNTASNVDTRGRSLSEPMTRQGHTTAGGPESTNTREPTVAGGAETTNTQVPTLRDSKVTWKQRIGFGSSFGGAVGLAIGVLVCAGTGPPGWIAGGVIGLYCLGGAVAGAASTPVAYGAYRGVKWLGNRIWQKCHSQPDESQSDYMSWHLQHIDQDRPAHFESVKSHPNFTARVQQLMNKSAKTGDLPVFDTDHVYETFVDEVARVDITVWDGSEMREISKVLSRERDLDNRATYCRTPSNKQHTPSMKSQKRVAHKKSSSQGSTNFLPSKNSMLKNLSELTAMLGEGEIGEKATEIVTSSLHQGLFASVVTQLNESLQQEDGSTIPQPFGCRLFLLNDQDYAQTMKCKRVVLDYAIEIRERIRKLQARTDSLGHHHHDSVERLERRLENLTQATYVLAELSKLDKNSESDRHAVNEFHKQLAILGFPDFMELGIDNDEVQNLRRDINGCSIEDLKKQRDRVCEIIPRLHIEKTNQSGVYHFSAHYYMPVRHVIVEETQTISADSTQTNFMCKIEGAIDVNKESDYITLDEGYPHMSLNVVAAPS